MNTEITYNEFKDTAKEPLGLVWKLGKTFVGVAKKAEKKRKEREQIEKHKSELQAIGLGDIDSVRNALQQRNITVNEYLEIIKILES